MKSKVRVVAGSAFPVEQCSEQARSAIDIQGSQEFPLAIAFASRSAMGLLQSSFNLDQSARLQTLFETKTQTIQVPHSTAFEQYYYSLVMGGAVVRFYMIDQNHFQILIDQSTSRSFTSTALQYSAIYQVVHAGAMLPRPTPVSTPTPVVTAPVSTRPNRCSVDRSYVTIDGKKGFYASNSDTAMLFLNQLMKSGFCTSDSTLGVDGSYVTINQKKGFYASTGESGLANFLQLYQAKAGTAETARCGVEGSYLSLDNHRSFYFSTSETGISQLLELIRNGACRP